MPDRHERQPAPARNEPARRGAWAWLFPFLAGRWGSLSAAVLLACITIAAGVALLSVAGWFLTGAFLATAASSFNLFVPSALVRALAFVRIGSRYLERVIGHSATFAFLADIRVALYASVAQLSPAQLARYRDGDLVARLVGDVDALDAVFLLLIAPLLSVAAAGLLFGWWVAWMMPAGSVWWLLPALLAMMAGIPSLVVRRSADAGERLRLLAARSRMQVHDAVAAHAELTVFSGQAEAAFHFLRVARAAEAASDRLSALGSAGALIQQICAALLLGLLLWVGLMAYAEGGISAPVWVGMILGALGLFEAMGPLVRGVARIGVSATAARRVDAVMRQTPDVRDVPAPRAVPARGALEFSNVSLQYDARAPEALSGISLSVQPGERIALTGASGSGKSSLLALMMRIVEPTAGMIRYAGVPLSEMRQAELHQRIALLSQDSPVFLGTIRQNLRIGDPHAGDAQLWDALKQAGLAGFVQSLEDGLDAWVGEAGRTLSAGQARRLCLARLLLTDADVWLLDEPTAGLDRRTRLAFFQDLAMVAGQRTVVLATHADLPDGVVTRELHLRDGRIAN